MLFARLYQAGASSVSGVFSLRYVFKVPGVAVGLDAILMVDLHTVGTRPDKRFGHKCVDVTYSGLSADARIHDPVSVSADELL